jgi:hypothetical protein
VSKRPKYQTPRSGNVVQMFSHAQRKAGQGSSLAGLSEFLGTDPPKILAVLAKVDATQALEIALNSSLTVAPQ